MTNITFKVGNELSTETVNLSNDSDTCRTPEQVAAFIKHYINSDIVFFCGNPFRKYTPTEKHNCTFVVIGYNADYKMVAFKITPKGKIKGHHVMDYPDVTGYNMVNKTDAEHRAEMIPIIELNKRLNITNFAA